ncbi:MAG TPA: asparagine synthase (glutamine-hydrolyzing) [Blastocatellia bacterium]|nr:asparagine synthase (glutamine-hydrolyzing) [Blastocatellia bacterium]
MCGIAGSINWGDETSLNYMNDLLTHRGPDDQGIWLGSSRDGGFVGLASRRLSILDLSSAGRMPMSTVDGRLTITYNGEIYNQAALRRDLEAKGCVFRSRTDTEVVLYLYEHYGAEGIPKLNGMFAFAIWDSLKQELFVARDHFGIKPLYYCHRDDRFAFASEVKALLALPDAPRRINKRALDQYLTFLWVPDPLTMFDEILKLPAGHFGRWREGEFQTEQYWDLEFPASDHDFTKPSKDLEFELRDRFCSSVNAQLQSDVPVGSFLSAGLDSSCVLAAMSRATSERLRTYTITFPNEHRRGESTLDDPRVAHRTAEHFGCEHTEIVVEPDVAGLLPKLVYHMDEPVGDPAIVSCYLIAQRARESSTVLLSGVGGDELFAGYRKHAAVDLARKYQRIPTVLRERLLEPIALALPSMRGTPLKGHVRLAKKMARAASHPPREFFLLSSSYLSATQIAELYAPGFRDEIQDGQTCDEQTWAQHLRYFDHVGSAEFLNQMLYVDTKAFMVSLNLTYTDKMTMASSVETRVPFLDWELAEWVAWNIPPSLKIRGGQSKHILREAMGPLLPREVLDQKKAGFGAPVDYWLSSPLRQMVGDLLNTERVSDRGLFDPAAVNRMVGEHWVGRHDWSLQIWALLTLELWNQAFID